MARRVAAGSRRRLDHLHVRIHRHAEGCRGHASQRRRVRRRGSANVLAGQPHWARRPGAGRTVGRVRRVVRGDVAGLAARGLPGARATFAGAQRHGPGAVAGVPRHHRGVDGADAGGAVARRGARGGAAADLRRRGVPAGAGRAAGRRGPRGVEHLRPDRGDGGGVRGPAGRYGPGEHRTAAARLGSGGGRQRGSAGEHRRGRRARHRRGGAGPLPGSGQGRREVRRDADARMVTRLPQRRLGATGTRRPVLRRPSRRPGQGRRPPHRARRGGRRAW